VLISVAMGGIRRYAIRDLCWYTKPVVCVFAGALPVPSSLNKPYKECAKAKLTKQKIALGGDDGLECLLMDILGQ
jgi:hypothetical protein